MSFLDAVVAERRADAAKAAAAIPEQALLDAPAENAFAAGGARDGSRSADAFTAALRARKRDGRIAVIAEVKRVSPALGTLTSDVDPARQAKRYAAAGASAISVLTEPRHWGGSLRDLAAVRAAVPAVPVLCKDIIVSAYQIAEARAAGADAVLLIAEALSDEELRAFIDRARDLRMGALVEAHEAEAFTRAVASGAPVIGANARDLRDPRNIDTGRARQLQAVVRKEQVFVAESGITSVEDARALPGRVDAVLVGTALMRAPDPAPLISGIAAIGRRVTV